MLNIDDILYFAFMQEQEEKQQEIEKSKVNYNTIPKPNEPRKTEIGEEKNFFPEI